MTPEIIIQLLALAAGVAFWWYILALVKKMVRRGELQGSPQIMGTTAFFSVHPGALFFIGVTSGAILVWFLFGWLTS